MGHGVTATVVDELAIDAHADEARRASEWLESCLLRRGVPQAEAARLTLCMVEVLANVIAHGGEAVLEAPTELLLEVNRAPDRGEARVTVSDHGRAFNPLTVPERARPLTLEDAAPGGMGMRLIRRCADAMEYRHEDGLNRLVFTARWRE